ncbi:hypothetical protein BH09MYX1_BH09MYX1_13040 [soil metagenome]
MIERFDGGEASGDYELGIIGSTHRAVALQSMAARLDDDAPIPSRFLYTLALLRDSADNPGAKYDWPRRSAILERLTATLAGALGRRSTKNRALSTATVLELAWSNSGLPDPTWLASVMATLPLVFEDLPAAEQMTIVEYKWKWARDPALALALRNVYDDPRSTPDQREAMLHRLLELDPPGARTRVLEHLRTGLPVFGYRSLRSVGGLPDATLPALDTALADRAEKDAYGAMPELTRYATASILAPVKRMYSANAGAFASDLEGEFLAYFLRVEPAFGEKAAMALLTGKHTSAGAALKKAAELYMTPGLERVLLVALTSTDSDLVVAAAEALEGHGSATSAAPLWKRFGEFHAAWAGREADLSYSVTGGTKNEAAVRLETALWRAVVRNYGFVADKAAIARAQSLVVRREEQAQVGYETRFWEGGPEVGLGADEPLRQDADREQAERPRNEAFHVT